MFSLMSKAEYEKRASRQHHDRRHGNSRMKEPVPMEMGAAALKQEKGKQGGGAAVGLYGFSNSV